MPIHYTERNKAICHLYQIGWSKYSIAKLFQMHGGWKKSGIYLVLRRDISKYPLPSVNTIKKIQEELLTLFGKKIPQDIITKDKNDAI